MCVVGFAPSANACVGAGLACVIDESDNYVELFKPFGYPRQWLTKKLAYKLLIFHELRNMRYFGLISTRI
jgi:hypothetical protein